MFVGFIVSLALCILSNCETNVKGRGKSLHSGRNGSGFHHIFWKKRGYFCMCVQFKKSFFSGRALTEDRSRRPGTARGPPDDVDVRFWRTGVHEDWLMFTFGSFCGNERRWWRHRVRFIETRVQKCQNESFRIRTSKCVYRVCSKSNMTPFNAILMPKYSIFYNHISFLNVCKHSIKLRNECCRFKTKFDQTGLNIVQFQPKLCFSS